MPKNQKSIETLTHTEATRRHIPTAEYQALVEQDEPPTITYPRNRDLDPQLMWRGKDEQDWSDLVVPVPPLYIQEKIHPKVLIDDLARRSASHLAGATHFQLDMFADFNGLPSDAAKTEFYRHEANWSNRMILGDSLQVMASLAEREGLRGQVQCIYLDPPYGIKFNSNFQWSTTSRNVTDGKSDHITREPEQVKAFRDTWRDGIHSYLTYLRDRLTVARDLLAESGSIFVQIGDENVHRVRAVMDEVFGDENFVSQICIRTTTGRANANLAAASNYILWSSKNIQKLKYRSLFDDKGTSSSVESVYRYQRNEDGTISTIDHTDTNLDLSRVFRIDNLTSSRPARQSDVREFYFEGKNYTPGKGTFKTDLNGLTALSKANRIWGGSGSSMYYIRFYHDFAVVPFSNMWIDTGTGGFTDPKIYVVQTNTKVIQRCILMTTDPGDLVLDPTCGSGTTAYVAEQWGRRWITIDTSRVALACH